MILKSVKYPFLVKAGGNTALLNAITEFILGTKRLEGLILWISIISDLIYLYPVYVTFSLFIYTVIPSSARFLKIYF